MLCIDSADTCCLVCRSADEHWPLCPAGCSCGWHLIFYDAAGLLGVSSCRSACTSSALSALPVRAPQQTAQCPTLAEHLRNLPSSRFPVLALVPDKGPAAAPRAGSPQSAALSAGHRPHSTAQCSTDRDGSGVPAGWSAIHTSRASSVSQAGSPPGCWACCGGQQWPDGTGESGTRTAAGLAGLRCFSAGCPWALGRQLHGAPGGHDTAALQLRQRP